MVAQNHLRVVLVLAVIVVAAAAQTAIEHATLLLRIAGTSMS